MIGAGNIFERATLTIDQPMFIYCCNIVKIYMWFLVTFV